MFEMVRILRLLFKSGRERDTAAVLEHTSRLARAVSLVADAVATPIDGPDVPTLTPARTRFLAGVAPAFGKELDAAEREAAETVAALDSTDAPATQPKESPATTKGDGTATAPKPTQLPANDPGRIGRAGIMLAAVMFGGEILSACRARFKEKYPEDTTAEDTAGENAAGEG